MNQAFFAAALVVLFSAAATRADIFQWEYIDPAEPSQGKRQSTALAPDGAGVNAVPGADFSGRDLTMAYLIGADLTNAYAHAANFTDADLSHANLSEANFNGNTFGGADFSFAQVQGANFGIDSDGRGTGITLAQLYSTASYQAHKLNGLVLWRNNLAGANFAGQNLTNADLSRATLTAADFNDADVRWARFDFTGLTLAQVYSTASYQAKDLSGIGLRGNDFAGAHLSGQNLTSASFVNTMLNDADFSGAHVQGANLSFSTHRGFTAAQLYSTASYQAGDLAGIGLHGNDLSGWNFAGQNLSKATLSSTVLWGTILSDAFVQGTNFTETTRRGFTAATLYASASYKAADLTGIILIGNDLTGWNFVGQNLTNAAFDGATLSGADFTEANLMTASFSSAMLTGTHFTGARVRGAGFSGSGITLAQLYDTASYIDRDMRGIDLSFNDLARANFAGQNLANAQFAGANLNNANLRKANLTYATFGDSRGSATLVGADLTGADARGALDIVGDFTNAIRFDGVIYLNLNHGEKLVAYPGVSIPVRIKADFSIAADATFDLTDNAAIVNYIGASPVITVREKIVLGRGGAGHGGIWTGKGITSSTSAAANQAAPDSHSLGYAENATLPLGAYTVFHGVPVDGTSILIAFTRTGDANLDGIVNDDDVTILGAYYAPGVPQPSWALGDFDYNGFVDDDDVTLLGAFYDPSAAPSAGPPAEPGANVVAVAEPCTCALFVLAAVAIVAWGRAGSCFSGFMIVGRCHGRETVTQRGRESVT